MEVHLLNLAGFLQAVPALLQLRDHVSSFSRCRNSDGLPANTFRNSVPQTSALLMSQNAKFSGLPLGLVLLNVSNVINVRDALSGCMIEKKLLALVARLAPPLP